jgi:hypothetical protein
VPLKATPLPKGDRDNATLVGEAQNLHYLVATLRKDHGVRVMRSVVGKEGPAVAFKLFPAG